ncbi:MAG: DUF1579 domain-containing protein [Acidobacteriota bacterium]|nr:DUF1579 domain-containing protein [Acidobacteriota bacterium]
MRMLALLLIAAVVVAGAQEKKDANHMKDMKAPKKADMNAPQSAEMKKLEKMLAGTWSLDETFESMMGMPGGKGKGTEVSKRGPGGNSLHSDLKSTGPMGSFTGHGLMWYDAKAGGYRSIWCDTMTPQGCDDSGIGKWQGNDLVFEGDSDMPPNMGGGKMHMVQKFSDITPNSFTFSMDGTMNGQNMHMMTIKYKRAGGGMSATATKQ